MKMKIKKRLPVLSAIEYGKKPINEQTLLGKIGHALYAASGIAIMLSTAFYIDRVRSTGEFNIFKQGEVYAEEAKIRKEEIRRKVDLTCKLFGLCGSYANTDRVGGIDFGEKVEAWKRMGFDTSLFMSGEKFPKPTLLHLENAVKSYEDDMKRERERR